MRILVACEFSGIVRNAFIAKGHDAWSCDLRPTEQHPVNRHHQGDVLEILDDRWDMLLAFPDCTFLTVTGNKWFYHPDDKHLPFKGRRPHPRFPNRWADREKAIKFFMLFANAPIPRICIENPVGIISTVWRKPDQIIQPFEYGHIEPKKTCLWLKNLPLLKSTKIVEPDYMISKSGKRLPRWYHQPSFTPDRQKNRSRTFQGIADAMADQWTEPYMDSQKQRKLF